MGASWIFFAYVMFIDLTPAGSLRGPSTPGPARSPSRISGRGSEANVFRLSVLSGLIGAAIRVAMVKSGR